MTLKEIPVEARVVLGLIAAIVGLIILFVFNPFYKIDSSERGLVLTWGKVGEQVVQPGLHVRVPVMQRVVKYNIRTQKLEVNESKSYSKDLQLVTIHSAVNYNLNPSAVGDLYKQLGLDYEDRVLIPILETSIKTTIARFTAEELISKRSEAQSQIEFAFMEKIPKELFTVTNYSLVNEDFSDEYEKAIESKQVAQQDAEKAKNVLVKVQMEAEQRVAQAEAEARAIKIQAEAIQQQGGENYVQLQAITKWNGILPVQMIPGSTLPFLNLTTTK